MKIQIMLAKDNDSKSIYIFVFPLNLFRLNFLLFLKTIIKRYKIVLNILNNEECSEINDSLSLCNT